MEFAGPTIQDPTSFQFLSVCHYVLRLGIFFYSQNLISPEWHNHSGAILNKYFDYIHNSENESETKLQLLREILNGTDLYGGGENETLDMKYVNETYQYIISNALFSAYGHIQGYLAQIIHKTDNITYLSLKKNVFRRLIRNFINKEYCSSRYESIGLTTLAVNKIFNENIWSIFPEPEGNPEIIDTNYIYAMVGLKIARTVQVNAVNLRFDSYIRLAREIVLRSFQNKNYKLLLRLFETPALFYYFYKEKNASHLISKLRELENLSFHKVFESFFIFLTNSDHENAIFKIKKIHSKNIDMNLRLIITRHLIDTEKKLLWQTFLNSKAKILKLNSAVVFADVVQNSTNNCSSSALIRREINTNIFPIFAIITNGQKDYYAIKDTWNDTILLSYTEHNQEFAKECVNDTSLEIKIQNLPKVLKSRGENFQVFIRRLSFARAEHYVNKIMFRETNPTVEKIRMDYLQSLLLNYTHKPLTPGSELSYQAAGITNRWLRKKSLNALMYLVDSSPEIENFLRLVKFGSSVITGNTTLVPDSTGLIPKVFKNNKKFKIVRYFYPGGLNYFGPKCQVSVQGVAEIRNVNVIQSRPAVVPVKTDKRVVYNLHNSGIDTLSHTYLTKLKNDSSVLYEETVTENGRPKSLEKKDCLID